jgi:DNA-binding transcriptional ArsR family regulator
VASVTVDGFHLFGANSSRDPYLFRGWFKPVGSGVKALLVGLALWHLKRLRQADTFIVSNLMLQEWGVQPDAKRRALHKLEKAGLIKIERRGKRSPQVTLVVGNRFEGGTVAAVENSGQPRAVAGPCNLETPGKE